MKRLALLFSLAITGSALAAPSTKTILPERFDPQYPTMQNWAQAGVLVDEIQQESPLVVRLKPGDDLTAAAASDNTTIYLAPGNYPLEETLTIGSHVIIHGSGIGQTRLVIMLRDLQNAPTEEANHAMPEATGVLFENTIGSGIENLSITMDESLLKPNAPHTGPYAYENNPHGQDDLHITLVRFTNSRSSWLKNCELLNAGSHPLILDDSQHLTIEGTEIYGAYNKSDSLGMVILSGVEFCLLDGMLISDINHVLLRGGNDDRKSRYNVIANSRITVDVRFQSLNTDYNLLENCEIAVPPTHHAPPISYLTKTNELPSTNLLFLCTITRDFPTGNRRFSVAGNPNKVYRLLGATSLKTSIEEFGEAPIRNTLWPVRF